MATENLIKVVRIKNISTTVLQIGVADIEDPTSITNFTDMTGQTVTILDAAGLVKLYPAKTMTVEEDRINLGQIENFRAKSLVIVEFFSIDPETLTLSS